MISFLPANVGSRLRSCPEDGFSLARSRRGEPTPQKPKDGRPRRGRPEPRAALFLQTNVSQREPRRFGPSLLPRDARARAGADCELPPLPAAATSVPRPRAQPDPPAAAGTGSPPLASPAPPVTPRRARLPAAPPRAPAPPAPGTPAPGPPRAPAGQEATGRGAARRSPAQEGYSRRRPETRRRRRPC